MSTTLKLPRVGMNMEEGTIVEWFVKPGEKFLEGDKLYALETDKTTAEIEAPISGTWEEILAKDGEDVTVGDPICIVKE
jgi:pyruvate/2-oxoglutarate dehydrogenase complex dihydrolipoamide acyltransferase (E2) component